MAKSKFFRVAVEGSTATDGRVIERNWIQEMAASYDRATYGARINMEHIRGFSGEAPFKAYGDVLSVKAEEVTLKIDGKDQKRLALFAEIDPTDDLVKLTKARQKIYTSIEVQPNFGGTGKAGLVGLAVTDSPASLGTEILSFSSKPEGAAIKQMFDDRKQDAGNVFSAAHETSIEIVDDTPEETPLDKVIAGFARMFDAKEPKPNTPTPAQAQQQMSDASDAATLIAAFKDLSVGLNETIKASQAAADKRIEALSSDLTALKADVEATPRAADMGLQVFSRLLAFGVEEGRLQANIVTGISRLYSSDRSMIIWTPEDLTALEEVASAEVYRAVRLASLTGLRKSDLLRLSWSHIKAHSIEIPTGKSKQRKTTLIPIYGELRRYLDSIPRTEAVTTVLVNTRGLPWKSGFGASLNDALKAAKIDKHLHDTRGTAATAMFVGGLTIREIAEMFTWSEDYVERLINMYVKKDELLRDRIRRLDEAERRTPSVKPAVKPVAQK